MTQDDEVQAGGGAGAPPDGEDERGRSLRDLVGGREERSAPVDPLELFGNLEIRSDDLQEMWVPQGDALREWHEHRDNADILFKLNTGAGKTLIGLVAAQSLINETQGRVLYVCATNQLLEQTREKAGEYGIDVATYFGGDWHGDAYHRAAGPGLTNYHAVFNGLSVFQHEDIEAMVFDDAHTASAIVREQFTLSVRQASFPDAYRRLVELVHAYFRETRRARIFEEVAQGEDPFSVLFVPLFVTTPLAPEFEEILDSEGVVDDRPAVFPWNHLRGRLADCAMLLKAGEIDFTPLVPPVHTLRPFRDGVRRLYLSATLDTGPEFCRTFGREPDRVIAPGGRAGETERMILPAHRDMLDHQAIAWAKDLLAPYKALIMVPSYRAASAWEPEAEVFREGSDERIREFADSTDEKLVLVGRYDGIDLPGEDCRLLVVDGLPVGRSLLETFFTDQLELRGLSQGLIASRFVQLLGRISRGMSDHGVFLLVGRKLRRWLDDPRNRSLLPDHIRGQLELGERLASSYDEISPAALIRMCLDRDPDWLERHREFTRNDHAGRGTTEDAPSVQLALAEVEYTRRLWDERGEAAAIALNRVQDLAFESSRHFGGWHLHWIAHALALVGESGPAAERYRRAAKACPVLGRPAGPEALGFGEGEEESVQARDIGALILRRRGRLITEIENAIGVLTDGESTTNEQEEAVRHIGAALGFSATRPDNDEGTGPDDLWLTPDERTAFVLELKTDKDDTEYSKDEIGQLHQHIQWVRDKYPEAEQRVYLIGPRRGCTPEASPPPTARVASADEVARLGDDVRRLSERVLSRGGDLFTAGMVQAGLVELQLRWSELPERIESVELVALGVR